MAYVRRDEAGHIVAVSYAPLAPSAEGASGPWVELPARDPELLAFLRGAVFGEVVVQPPEVRPNPPGEASGNTCPQGVSTADAGLIRVLEDLIDLLIERGVIRFTDLPQAAQAKLTARRHWRADMRKLTLLDEDDSDVI